MKSLLKLSQNRSMLLRAGTLALSGYLALWAFIAVQFGAGERETTSAGHGAEGWREVLEPIQEKKGAPLVVPGNLDATKEDLREIDRLQRLLLAPQPQPQTPPIIVAVPAGTERASSSTASGGASASSQAKGADNGPAQPSVRITRITPDQPRTGRTTRVEFSGGDQDGIVRAVVIDWGNGKTDWYHIPDRCTDEAHEAEHSFPPVEHTYSDPGEYRITVGVYSAGTCKRGDLQFATDHRDIVVGLYAPPNPITG